MSFMHFMPWVEIGILIPLLGAVALWFVRDPFQGRKLCTIYSGLALLVELNVWNDFIWMDPAPGTNSWSMTSLIFQRPCFIVDQFNAPLLPLIALLFFFTSITTARTKIRRFSFAWTLLLEAILLATFSCHDPQLLIVLLGLGAIPPYMELRGRGKPTGTYVAHMLLFIVMLVLGWTSVAAEGLTHTHSLQVLIPLLIAILIRSGVAPFHCWMTDLCENATFGTAILNLLPITGAYAAVRLLLPIAPFWVMRSMGTISLFTAVYAAGMALIQTEGRRFFCYLFLSHSAMVLVGLEAIDKVALTGGLCVWLSIGLALGGFGLCLRSIESRRGRVSMNDYQGLYEKTPLLANIYLLLGLASVGFPGTFGFIGMEMLVDGVVEEFPYTGALILIASAFNGIAVIRSYFLLFTGVPLRTEMTLGLRARERFVVVLLALIILGGGFFPQPGITFQHAAALHLLENRKWVDEAEGIEPLEEVEHSHEPAAHDAEPADMDAAHPAGSEHPTGEDQHPAGEDHEQGEDHGNQPPPPQRKEDD